MLLLNLSISRGLMPSIFVGQSIENIQNAQTTLQHRSVVDAKLSSSRSAGFKGDVPEAARPQKVNRVGCSRAIQSRAI
jgi:hypothetical protein